ncbi:FkbM family methyltransferase [Candidatus Methylospira mobilis]|uniref:FkbM family methyltransferase n=1 Tax=Candidatus Methylospira mobilis TaxID=1808979 RepID=A0A5Q0BJ93_9GAMM|nr:FkbM family methyltransferase [Candidatus Methylospira mobilis]QFY41886.1 FkbM family methyltransferase [Candidatus Methylospira mobilis]
MNTNSSTAYTNFLEYILINRLASPSQLLQDLFVLYFTNCKREGFFVEFGATNGVSLSNSYLLENQFGWNGILAEPLPSWHADLERNRKCIIDKRCVYSVTGQMIDFLDAYDSPEMSGIQGDIKADGNSYLREKNNIFSVQTVSLNDLLIQHNAPDHIDYLSVDTEGSEYEILKEFDFARFNVSIITVEHNFMEPQRTQLKELLERFGFVRVFENLSRWDDWYLKRYNPVLLLQGDSGVSITREQDRNAIEKTAEEALALQQQGLLDDAERLFRVVHAADPANIIALHCLSVILVNRGSYSEALPYIALAAKVNPNFEPVWFVRGIAMHALRRYEEALESFDRVLALNPEYPEALVNRDNLLNEMKSLQSAP